MLRPTTNVKEDDCEMLMGFEKDWGVSESLMIIYSRENLWYSKGNN